MSELRSGNEQLTQELNAMYFRMTDPREIQKEQDKKRRLERKTKRQQNYGL